MNELAREITLCREQHGFITDWNNMLSNLMLVVTEVAEAAECVRNDNRDGFNEEVADTIIRLLDIAGALEIDIEAEIKRKMFINEKRPYKHGKRM